MACQREEVRKINKQHKTLNKTLSATISFSFNLKVLLPKKNHKFGKAQASSQKFNNKKGLTSTEKLWEGSPAFPEGVWKAHESCMLLAESVNNSARVSGLTRGRERDGQIDIEKQREREREKVRYDL